MDPQYYYLNNLELYVEIVKCIGVSASIPFQYYLLYKIVATKQYLSLKNHIVTHSVLNIIRTKIYLYECCLNLFNSFIHLPNTGYTDAWFILYGLSGTLDLIENVFFVLVQILTCYQSCCWVKIMIGKRNRFLFLVMFAFAPLTLVFWLLSKVIFPSHDENIYENYDRQLDSLDLSTETVYNTFLVLSVLLTVKCFVQIKYRVDTTKMSASVKRTHHVMVTTLLVKSVMALYDPLLSLAVFVCVEHNWATGKYINGVFDLIYTQIPFLTALVTYWSMKGYFKRVDRGMQVKPASASTRSTATTKPTGPVTAGKRIWPKNVNIQSLKNMYTAI